MVVILGDVLHGGSYEVGFPHFGELHSMPGIRSPMISEEQHYDLVIPPPSNCP